MDLSKLNEDQKRIIQTNQGSVMVLAGAGSGKTGTLVNKVVYLLSEKRVSPFQVLALTFSNKAAKEMRDRVNSMVVEDLGSLQITTFHSFCAKVLRSEFEHLGLSRNFTIYDATESKAVIKSILQRNHISTKEISPFEVLYFINNIKNKGYYVGKMDGFKPDTEDLFHDFYQQYESELKRTNAIDFGGLITGVIQLFEQFPRVLDRYQVRYKYILIDEYQDTNSAQFELIRLISNLCDHLCVVGDEDQSIYSWRGAEIKNILDFEKIFPNVQVFRLEQNYRSTKIIIEAAGHVIAKNTMRKGKQMWTRNCDGSVIEIIECQDDKKESEWISSEILKLNQREGKFYRNIAVFYRTNAQSRLIEDAFRKNHIPYRVVGGIKFYERKEIKDLLAYIRLVTNIKDNLAFSRVINTPARGIGATTLRKLEREAIKNNISLFEMCEAILESEIVIEDLRISAKAKSSLNHFVGLINEVKALEQLPREKVKPSVLYKKILHESGYYDQIKASKDYESVARIENLEELGNAISHYEKSTLSSSLLGFFETVTLDAQTDDATGSNNGEVSMMTIHGAKGLEFSYVFVSGVEENIFPNYKSFEDGIRAEEEERRLFYVAMTRAMEKLYLTFAQGRMLFGQLKFNGPSRFLYEIPKHYYCWKKVMGFNETGAIYSNNMKTWMYKPDNQEIPGEDDKIIYRKSSKVLNEKKTKSFKNSKFVKGTRVRHALYGSGFVLDSKGFGQDEKVLIKFNDGTRKKFMTKFAPLAII